MSDVPPPPQRGRAPVGGFHSTPAHSSALPTIIALRTSPTSGSATAPPRPLTVQRTRPSVARDRSLTTTRVTPPWLPAGSVKIHSVPAAFAFQPRPPTRA